MRSFQIRSHVVEVVSLCQSVADSHFMKRLIARIGWTGMSAFTPSRDHPSETRFIERKATVSRFFGPSSSDHDVHQRQEHITSLRTGYDSLKGCYWDHERVTFPSSHHLLIDSGSQSLYPLSSSSSSTPYIRYARQHSCASPTFAGHRYPAHQCR